MDRNILAFFLREGSKAASDLMRIKVMASQRDALKVSKDRIDTIPAPTSPPSITSAPRPLVTALHPHSSEPAVTDDSTLTFQLDFLLDELLHLETDHLPRQGKIGGYPCDCIAKASRELRRHARETIPIAARAGYDSKLFADIADEADYLMEVGTLAAVRSGEYRGEYLKHAGIISNYRKQIDRLLVENKQVGSADCPECRRVKELAKIELGTGAAA